MSDPEINSQAYWERRFLEDWDSNLGREQSRFFANLAVDALPTWLATTIRHEQWSICDWGCAEGDGTKVLMETFARNRIEGVDFSRAAVETARARYGDRFVAENWLDEAENVCERADLWDLVFSSNTLEHFQDPCRVLGRLCDRAKGCVTLLVPYRELERHPEHAATFLPENIPFIPQPGFVLCYTRTIDAALAEPSYWGGDQVLLVYLRTETAERMHLTAEQGVVDLGEREVPSREALAQADSESAQIRARPERLDEEPRLFRGRADLLAQEARKEHALNLRLVDRIRDQDARIQDLSDELSKLAVSHTELAERLKEVLERPLRLWLLRVLGHRD